MRSGDYAVLLAAPLAFVLSIYLWFGGQRKGWFVGLWGPSTLAFAIFVKLTTGRT